MTIFFYHKESFSNNYKIFKIIFVLLFLLTGASYTKYCLPPFGFSILLISIWISESNAFRRLWAFSHVNVCSSQGDECNDVKLFWHGLFAVITCFHLRMINLTIVFDQLVCNFSEFWVFFALSILYKFYFPNNLFLIFALRH